MVELRKVLGEMSLANEQLRAMVKELQQELVMLRQRTVANEEMAREERKLAREEFKLAQEKFHQELQWNKDQARQWYEETQRLRGELAKETACHQELLAQMLGCGGNQALQPQQQAQPAVAQQHPQRQQKQQQQRPPSKQATSQSSLQQRQQQQQQQQQQRMTYANVAAETSGTQASQGGSWTVVGPRKAPQKPQQQQQQQLAKPRPQSAAAKHSAKKKLDAIEVAPGEGQSWTDVYQMIRSAPSLAEDQAKLGVGRRTTRDRLVMDLQDGVNSAEILLRVLEVSAQAAPSASTRLVTETVEAWNGTQTAYVRMTLKAAELMHQQRVRVLHTSCLATKLTPPTRGQLRCFKCLEHGHLRHQ
ncbi:putative uncharacterized protein DDB_G0271606 [Anopheles moucheti]|uniref:putative uncharacterized protein DDB_G0271606 n=1 Tax=Anopheles moucheti TaxID=186751 RepID=UPI0022F0BE55|nr:putative uncharacterized protein DDB_G0271606 [Anopheles moucheti]